MYYKYVRVVDRSTYPYRFNAVGILEKFCQQAKGERFFDPNYRGIQEIVSRYATFGYLTRRKHKTV